MLAQYLFNVGTSVADDGPTSNKHWVDISNLLGPESQDKTQYLHNIVITKTRYVQVGAPDYVRIGINI